jgi:hypothetical protein
LQPSSSLRATEAETSGTRRQAAEREAPPEEAPGLRRRRPATTVERCVQGPVTYSSLRGASHARYEPLSVQHWGAWP